MAVAGLWLGSGREVLTKQRRPVEVVVEDSVFGDASTEIQWKSGPILGYYVGLDLVFSAAAVSLVGAGLIGWRSRQGARRARGRQDVPRF